MLLGASGVLRGGFGLDFGSISGRLWVDLGSILSFFWVWAALCNSVLLFAALCSSSLLFATLCHSLLLFSALLLRFATLCCCGLFWVPPSTHEQLRASTINDSSDNNKQPRGTTSNPKRPKATTSTQEHPKQPKANKRNHFTALSVPCFSGSK